MKIKNGLSRATCPERSQATCPERSRGKSRGFTLIEILVVIMIIGLIVGGIALNLSRAQKKGRDTQRITDMTSVAQALSAYYADNHIYPVAANYSPNLITALVPKYLQVLPRPVNASMPYVYNAVSPFTTYTLSTLTELDRDQGDGNPARKGYRIRNGEVIPY